MTKKTRPGALKPCACRSFAVIDGDEVAETTGCDRSTNRQFAQGHDAKLKSMLIRAGVAGYQVRWTEGDQVREGDPLAASRTFGFGHQVESGIRGRLDKLTRQAGAKAKKAAKPEPTEPEAKPDPTEDNPHGHGSRVKVGRWTYWGTPMPQGSAIYHAKSGERKVAEKGKWSYAG